MTSYIRKSIATVFTGAIVLAGTAGTANAAPLVQDQDGLVNVAVGDVTILENVDIGVAASVAANICDVKVGPVAVLGRAVDRSGDSETICESGEGPVTIEQN